MRSSRAASIERARCQDPKQSANLEWLDTNGIGFYALGSVAGIRTRRYHGLLVGPAKPEAPTMVWLNALEETLHLGGSKYFLHAHQYSGVVTPRGFEHLEEFTQHGCPQWLYRIDEASLVRECFLVEGFPGVVVRYCCSEDAELNLRPLVSGRYHHSLLAESAEAPFQCSHHWDLVTLHRDEGTLYLRSDAREFRSEPDWYYRFEYAKERERGLDYLEDLWSPGSLQISLKADTWAYFVAGLEDCGPLDPMMLLRWREAKDERFPRAKDEAGQLKNAGEHFIFRRGKRSSVVAGYPWFTDWGRDTFISLPGLFLADGKLGEAAETISGFLEKSQHGLIPNRILDDGKGAEYNSIDATLWLILGVAHWLEEGGDRRFFAANLYPKLQETLLTLERGTINGIQCDPADGLLQAGTMETQLTWMDARVFGVAVTPRFGKAVEINALWYNGLRFMTDWARELGDYSTERHFGKLANQTISSFTTLFWNAERRCLYDVIRPGEKDGRCRPNQLFAISLPFPMVVRSKAEQILEVVEAELLTPYGLRTLSPADPQYRGRFEGGPEQRDSAYHQGTVWPWLMGPYVRAALRTRGKTPAEVQRCRALLEPLLDSLQTGCWGQVAEVYDGDAPQREGGTPAQAWSVAELCWLLTRELSF